MSIFEPMHGFFRRRVAKSLNERAGRMHLVNRLQESTWGNFVFPRIDYLDDIEVNGQRVGQVDYGINPLRDRVYINMIDIQPEHQRQGIGLAVLWHLWLTHLVPIVPLYQYTSSDGFWYRARRRFAAAGAVIEDELRGVQDLELEQQRWQHLVPEPEHERLIREYWEWVESEKAADRPVGPGIR